MHDLFTKEVVDAILQTVLGALVPIFLFLSRKLYQYKKTRNIRKFWKAFLNRNLTIVITEYSPTGRSRFAKLAEITGNRYLVSQGTALSLAKLLDFCGERVTKLKYIFIKGDRSNGQPTENLIIMGSPAVNKHSRSMYNQLKAIYEIPYKFVWDSERVNIYILSESDQTEFVPNIKKGDGDDFALVIKATYHKVPLKNVLIIAGCHMWGTTAASEAVTDMRILNEIVKETKNKPDIAFIIKTRVVEYKSQGPELEINNHRYLEVLNPKGL